MTVRELIEALERFPDDASAYAYEGELIGVVIVRAGVDWVQLGVVECSPPAYGASS